jgi:hypothetical protein
MKEAWALRTPTKPSRSAKRRCLEAGEKYAKLGIRPFGAGATLLPARAPYYPWSTGMKEEVDPPRAARAPGTGEERRRYYNPVEKGHATFLQTSEETGGERTLIEVEVAPGGGTEPRPTTSTSRSSTAP